MVRRWGSWLPRIPRGRSALRIATVGLLIACSADHSARPSAGEAPAYSIRVAADTVVPLGGIVHIDATVVSATGVVVSNAPLVFTVSDSTVITHGPGSLPLLGGAPGSARMARSRLGSVALAPSSRHSAIRRQDLFRPGDVWWTHSGSRTWGPDAWPFRLRRMRPSSRWSRPTLSQLVRHNYRQRASYRQERFPS